MKYCFINLKFYVTNVEAELFKQSKWIISTLEHSLGIVYRQVEDFAFSFKEKFETFIGYLGYMLRIETWGSKDILSSTVLNLILPSEFQRDFSCTWKYLQSSGMFYLIYFSHNSLFKFLSFPQDSFKRTSFLLKTCF